MRSFAHVIADPQGLHARSCVMIAREAAKWRSDVKVHLGEHEADGKSMASMLALKGAYRDQIVVSCAGPDEVHAAGALEALMRMSL